MNSVTVQNATAAQTTTWEEKGSVTGPVKIPVKGKGS